MKKLISIILCILMLLSVCVISPVSFASTGNTYYVDSIDGDDTAGGTSPETAWRSLDGFANCTEPLKGGDTVLFRAGGTYECCVTLADIRGTKDAPFTISSYGEGERPILRTDNADEVFTFVDCSCITVSDLQITAPNGGGIWIDTINSESVGITIENVYFYGLPNGKVTARDDFSRGAAPARAAVMVKGLPSNSRYPVNDLTIRNCEVYDSANGFMIWGSWNDQQDPWSENAVKDPIYNTGVLVEGCYFHEMDAEAVVVGICDGALVTNCRAINTCQGEGLDENGEIQYFTAAMWFWGSENSTIQYCEIAGQKNFGDGMTVDFDSDSNNCTYQYIYSHDNMRFVVNNAKKEPQRNNTVRYCLSVNDNKGRSSLASGSGEDNFKFYNNTIINSGEIQFYNLTNSLIANNIFAALDGAPMNCTLEDEFTAGNTYTNNCYYNTLNLMCDPLAINTDPGFSTNELIEAYQLAINSPLIGKGMKIEDGLTTDFFGNEIESCNIGCYMGRGEEPEADTENIFEMLIRFIRNIMQRLAHEFNVIRRELEEALAK
ncbi:MAG: hypothetical protein IJN70_04945 [Clostridia bacterium]|nr:hypothetical protein [Clostridia bacterium]